VWVARRCAAVQGATLAWPGGVPGALALAAVVVLVGAALRWRRLRAVVAAVLVGALLVLVPTRVVPPGWPPARWSLVACDVGQGDALVLATGEPGRAVLVALGPAREPADTLAQVTRRTATARAPLVGLGRGTVLRWPGLVLEVLGPVRTVAHLDGEDGSAVNDTSVVLRAHTPVGRVLLPGDAERSAQSSLLGTAGDLHAEILKVPHHGSRSSLPTFLTAARASLALVSVGRGNTYGHPNPGVMGLLAGSGALVRRTDESGDLAVVVGADPRAGPAVVARGDPRPDPRRR